MKTFLNTLPVAHRGLHDAEKPENSLAAYRAAVEHGYAIETDVHFSKDGVIVIFHDDNLKRMTGDERDLADCTLAELKELRLGGTDEQIPTLEEFLETVDGKVPLLIEIKNMANVSGKDIAVPLAAALKDYKGEYAIQSFNPLYVKAFKKERPDILCGVLAHSEMAQKGQPFRWRMRNRILQRLGLNWKVKPDFVSYGFWTLPVKCVTKFKGLKLAWTIRSPEDEAKARKYVDNIIFENYLAEK